MPQAGADRESQGYCHSTALVGATQRPLRAGPPGDDRPLRAGAPGQALLQGEWRGGRPKPRPLSVGSNVQDVVPNRISRLTSAWRRTACLGPRMEEGLLAGALGKVFEQTRTLLPRGGH